MIVLIAIFTFSHSHWVGSVPVEISQPPIRPHVPIFLRVLRPRLRLGRPLRAAGVEEQGQDEGGRQEPRC